MVFQQSVKEIEYEFFDLRLTGDGQDTLRWARLIYAQIVSLARGVQSSDAPPTDQQLEVHEMLRGHLEDVERRFREDGLGAIDELNLELRDRGVPMVTVRRSTTTS